MDQIKVIGVDIGKTSFHVVAVDGAGAVQLKRRCSRAQLMALMGKLTNCLVAMEACCGAHHLAREIAPLGHDVRLIAPQFVKPFLKSNKNDYLDAGAIIEAAQRPTMWFVPVKSVEQLDLHALHRVRERLVVKRTAVINQLRSFLLEHGSVFRAGRRHLATQMPLMFADERSPLSVRRKAILQNCGTNGNNSSMMLTGSSLRSGALPTPILIVADCWRSPALGRSLRPRLWLPWAMAVLSSAVGILRLGSAWWPGGGELAAEAQLLRPSSPAIARSSIACIRRAGVRFSIDGVHFASQISMPSSSCTTSLTSHRLIEPSSIPSCTTAAMVSVSRSAHSSMAPRWFSSRYVCSPK